MVQRKRKSAELLRKRERVQASRDRESVEDSEKNVRIVALFGILIFFIRFFPFESRVFIEN